MDYEYYVKYKGLSYLHCGWYKEGDLASLNKSSKGQLSRYLKKLNGPENEHGELEDPDVDLSWVDPERILDIKEEEVEVDMTEDEIVTFEAEEAIRDAAEAEAEHKASGALAAMDAMMRGGDGNGGDGGDDDSSVESLGANHLPAVRLLIEESNAKFLKNYKLARYTDPFDPLPADHPDIGSSMDLLRASLRSIEPNYPHFPESNNPYADGLLIGPPKRPRSSFVIFQILTRDACVEANPTAAPDELKVLLADKWQSLSEHGRAPYSQLMADEAVVHGAHMQLFEKVSGRAGEKKSMKHLRPFPPPRWSSCLPWRAYSQKSDSLSRIYSPLALHVCLSLMESRRSRNSPSFHLPTLLPVSHLPLTLN